MMQLQQTRTRFAHIAATLLLALSTLLTSSQIALSAEAPAHEFEGITTPYETIELGCSVMGVISEMKVDRSDVIDEKDVLCSLEANVERAQVELAQARLEMLDTTIALKQFTYQFAKREYERKRTLHQKDAISFYEFDEAETNMHITEIELSEASAQKEIARVELKRAKEVLNRMIIRSPVSGVVVERYLTTGELVNEQPILKLAQLNPLFVETIIPARHWGTIKKHTTAEIIPEIPLEGSFEGEVTVVDRIIDAESGMFGVRIELPNPGYTLPAGLKCRVVFHQQTGESDAIQ